MYPQKDMIIDKTLIGYDTANNFLPYYTNSPWSKEEDSFIFFSTTEYGVSLNRYNIITGNTTSILNLTDILDLKLSYEDSCQICLGSVYLSHSEQIIIPLANKVVLYNLNNSEKAETLLEYQATKVTGGILAIDRTQKLLTGTVGIKNTDNYACFVYDIENRKLLKQLDMPFFITHCQFLDDSDYILFAHEGKAETIPDRINILDWQTEEIINCYKQLHDKTGRLIEFVGHEMTANNRAVAVRYPISETADFGLLYIDILDHKGRLIDHDDYWHASITRNGKRAFMDTMWWGQSSRKDKPNFSDIIMYEFESRKKYILDSVLIANTSQIFHPHPQGNINGNRVLFVTCCDKTAENEFPYSKIVLLNLN